MTATRGAALSGPETGGTRSISFSYVSGKGMETADAVSSAREISGDKNRKRPAR
ncbi:hypothetical protein GH722_01065 [Alphaproteobacteria bacterium HT1-32]|nr:hypothetical protein [Alphaproteobacteria bacterium HT1-32]